MALVNCRHFVGGDCQLHQWFECPLVERGDGVAVISFNDFMKRRDGSRSECANGLKQVELLGFVSIEQGPRPLRCDPRRRNPLRNKHQEFGGK